MAHLHELIDFTVAVFIVFQNKVLLADHKKMGRWLSIGGHIELDEDPEQALFREIKEECGLVVEIIEGDKPPLPDVPGEVKFLHRPAWLDIHQMTATHRHIGLTYIAVAQSDKFTVNREEHHDLKWFTAAELADPKFNLLTNIKHYATEAIERVGMLK